MSAVTSDPRASRDDLPPPGAGDFYEIVNGVVVEPPPMGIFQSCVAMVLSRAIERYLASQGRFGFVMVEGLFLLKSKPNLQRRPDLAFVSDDRWPSDRPFPRGAAWGVAPDLAVEVVSPNDLATEIVDKVRDYFQHGVRQVWLIYPEQVTAIVYRSHKRIEHVGPDDELDGGDVLPGFRVRLADLVGPPPAEPADAPSNQPSPPAPEAFSE